MQSYKYYKLGFILQSLPQNAQGVVEMETLEVFYRLKTQDARILTRALDQLKDEGIILDWKRSKGRVRAVMKFRQLEVRNG